MKEKTDYNEANFDTYVSTESLLPGKKGRQAPSSLPQTGKVTVYKAGDILVSNIRPYFKKIWYADRTGTCSGDVLVFRAKQPEQSGYLYSRMRSDAFFDYIMKGAKGTKMPRGDKKQMLTYKVASNPSGATVDFIESALSQASSLSKEKHRLAALRDVLLPKLMSGEIDVSKVNLKQLNSHLAEALRPFGCHIPRNTKTGRPALLRAALHPGHHATAPTGTAPLLPKYCAEQALAFGLLLSVRTLRHRCHLPRLFAASTAHDLV